MFSTGKTTSERLYLLPGDYVKNSFCRNIYALADHSKTGNLLNLLIVLLFARHLGFN